MISKWFDGLLTWMNIKDDDYWKCYRKLYNYQLVTLDYSFTGVIIRITWLINHSFLRNKLRKLRTNITCSQNSRVLWFSALTSWIIFDSIAVWNLKFKQLQMSCKHILDWNFKIKSVHRLVCAHGLSASSHWPGTLACCWYTWWRWRWAPLRWRPGWRACWGWSIPGSPASATDTSWRSHNAPPGSAACLCEGGGRWRVNDQLKGEEVEGCENS